MLWVEEGADVIAVDICEQVETVPFAMATEDDLAETASLVEGTGRRIFTRKVDVRDHGRLEARSITGVALSVDCGADLVA